MNTALFWCYCRHLVTLTCNKPVPQGLISGPLDSWYSWTEHLLVVQMVMGSNLSTNLQFFRLTAWPHSYIRRCRVLTKSSKFEKSDVTFVVVKIVSKTIQVITEKNSSWNLINPPPPHKKAIFVCQTQSKWT